MSTKLHAGTSLLVILNQLPLCININAKFCLWPGYEAINIIWHAP